MMEEPQMAFVRDNPFVKNDGCRRFLRRSPVTTQVPRPPAAAERSAPAPPAGIPAQLGYAISKVSRTETKKMDEVPDDRLDTVSTGSASDIEYGPGIVEKLKAKFHRLSGMASKDAKVSPHTTFKRCPSMDDILASPEQSQRTEEPVVPLEPLSPIHRVHSKSTGDMLADSEEEKRSFTVHRNVRIEQDETDDVDAPSISTLRRKFEQSVQRRPSQNMRHAQVTSRDIRNRPVSMDISQHQLVESSLVRDAPPPREMRLVEARQAPPTYQMTSPVPQGIPERIQTVSVAPPLPQQAPPTFVMTSPVAPPTYQMMSPIQQGIPDRVLPDSAPEAAEYPVVSRPIIREAMFGDPSATPQLRVFEVKRSQQKGQKTNHHDDEVEVEERRAEGGGAKAPLRVLEVLNRAVVAPPAMESEPEFVRMRGRLRKSSVHLEDWADEERERLRQTERAQTAMEQQLQRRESVYSEETTRDIEQMYTRIEPKRFGLRNQVELPSLSSHARVIREGAAVRATEVMSPPDPHPNRQDPVPSSLLSPTFRDEVRLAPDASPPPEEPMPRELQPDTYSSPMISTLLPDRPSLQLPNTPQQIVPVNNDGSGVSEMQRLLSRFEKTRGERVDHRGDADTQRDERVEQRGEADRPTVAATLTSPVIQQQPRPFVPAVVGFRASITEVYDVTRPAQLAGSKPSPAPYSATGQSASPPTRTNVVSISVRDDMATSKYVIHRKYEDENGISATSSMTSSIKRQAPAPPLSAPPTEAPPTPLSTPISGNSSLASTPTSTSEPVRKSLSAKYLESKAASSSPVSAATSVPTSAPVETPSSTIQNREKPYGDAFTELKTEPKESSVDEEDEGQEEDIRTGSYDVNPKGAELPMTSLNSSEVDDSLGHAPSAQTVNNTDFYKDSEDSMSSSDSDSDEPPMASRPYTINFPEPLIAGDGNPVRHSLISLVMEEDIPQLMEAMSERYYFEFVDLVQRPSTSSIIHPMEKRKMRRRERQVSSIRFESTAPNVYTYLDEQTAESSQQWLEGTEVDYAAYQRMVECEEDECLEASLAELARWKQGVQAAATSASTTTASSDLENHANGVISSSSLEDERYSTAYSSYSTHSAENTTTISV